MHNLDELRIRWPIVVACMVGVGTGVTGLPFYTLGLFVGPLQEEFGWSRAAAQGMFSVFTVVGLICIPVVGWLVDRYGVRRVAMLSLCGAALGYSLLGVVTHSISSFYGCGAALAVLAAGTSPISWTRAIGGWFDRNRGLALGLALAGTGIAGWLGPRYVAALMANFGWREAYLGLAVLPALALPVVYLLLREPPVMRPEPSAPDAEVAQCSGLTIAQALRHYRFWLIAVGFFMVSMGIGGAIPNLVPLLIDAGLSRSTAAGYVGWLGLSVIVGRVLAGYLIDRFWAPGVAAVMLAIPALSALLLSQPDLNVSLLPLAIGLIGLAAGAEFDLIAYLASRYFGMLQYARIYAGLYAIFMLGAGIAPPLFGYCYDLTGSYQWVLQFAAVLFVIGALLLLALGRYPVFDSGARSDAPGRANRYVNAAR